MKFVTLFLALLALQFVVAEISLGDSDESEDCSDFLRVTTNSPGHIAENGEYFGFTNECADQFFGMEWHGKKFEVIVNGFLERILVFKDGEHCQQSCGRISPVISDHVYNFKTGDLLYHAKLAEPCPAGYLQVGSLSMQNNIVGDDLGVMKVATIQECQFACEELPNHKCAAFMFGNEDLKYKHGHYCKLSSEPIPEVDFGTNFRFCQRKIPCSKALRVINAYPGELGQKGEYFGFDDECANTFFGTKNWKNQHWHVTVEGKQEKIITFKEGPHCSMSCGRITPLDEHRANDFKLGDLIYHSKGFEKEEPKDVSIAASFEETAGQFTNFAMIAVLSGAAFGMGYYLSKFRAKSGLVSDYQNME